MTSPSLSHLAVIMDGNGRWAKSKKHRRFFGHVKGVKSSLEIIKHCSKIKIPFLSLFALSTENLHRPRAEVENLFKLLEKTFKKYSCFLFQEDIRLFFIGDLLELPPSIQKLCRQFEEETKKHRGLKLIIALNYGGRQEILTAFKKAYAYYFQKSYVTKDIQEEKLRSFFPSSDYPEPDLMIRTGGERRLSNFYLWSLAYTELYFTRTLWPDFSSTNLDLILEDFYQRKRLFGRL